MLVTLLRKEQRLVSYLSKWPDKKHGADKNKTFQASSAPFADVALQEWYKNYDLLVLVP